MRLSELHPSMTREQRDDLAKRCGISSGYLWQLATRWKGKKPTVDLLKKLSDADDRLTVAELVDEFGAVTVEPEPKAA
jgi:transcriptional regulator with XRE-family HTH domain